ncbi:MAG: hypothetical protein A3H97_20880 [Acidobacteria bacterium RIFCSPLOWO2_02_FULL_65_29]|nr:MAG: hypothetical protein A3H97_20880 [Acidobacteria bacterium RIFCSPLOWO2_02_FULL_65_29]
MKLIIKLAITALLANAAFRVGTEYLAHYQFRDSVRETAMFGAKNDEELSQRVIELAENHNIPLEPDAFIVRRDGREALVRGSYTKPIQIAPGFPYQWKFEFEVQVFTNTVPPLPGAPVRPARKP